MLTRCSVCLFKVGIPHRSLDITVPEDLFDLVEVQTILYQT